MDREISKTTLKIYVVLLESREPLGVRDIARILDLPVSTVYYHLRKLEDMGVVKEVGLGYTIANPLKLEDYVLIGRKLVPRLLLYSFFFLGVTIGELLVVISRGWLSYDAIVALVVSTLAFIILFYEGYRLRVKLWG